MTDYKYYCKNPQIKAMLKSLIKHKNKKSFEFPNSVGFFFSLNDDGSNFTESVYSFNKDSHIDKNKEVKKISLEKLIEKILE